MSPGPDAYLRRRERGGRGRDELIEVQIWIADRRLGIHYLYPGHIRLAEPPEARTLTMAYSPVVPYLGKDRLVHFHRRQPFFVKASEAYSITEQKRKARHPGPGPAEETGNSRQSPPSRSGLDAQELVAITPRLLMEQSDRMSDLVDDLVESHPVPSKVCWGPLCTTLPTFDPHPLELTNLTQ